MKALLVVAPALLLASCTTRPGAPTPRSDPNLITAEEIAAKPGPTLYDVVRALRPAWMMRNRPTALMPQNEGELIVYVDGTRYDNIDSLRKFVPNAVQTVRYYSPSDAEARFGPGHLHGAIEVITASH